MTKDFLLKDVLVGQVITLSDTQAMGGFLENKDDSTVFDSFQITDIKKMPVDRVPGLTYVFIDAVNVEDGEDEILVVSKILDNALETRVYFMAGDFTPGDRDDMMENEDWMFPDGKSGDYTDSVSLFISDGETEEDAKEYIFVKKALGILHGSAVDSVGESLPVMFCEYMCGGSYSQNNEAMITEEVTGGLIKLYYGAMVEQEKLEII